ncbi:MAG: GNAT family N-acetyltransferase, partial [Actinobacteria bacterium]|nr:GNAT family N-acetyltransferase [Actinomycetota bacterium]
MGGEPDEIRRIEDFITRLNTQVSDRIVEWRGGVAYLNDRLPRIWDVNFLELIDACLSADEIATHADEILGATTREHRRVRVADPALGAALQPAFTELGWETDVHVVMLHRREPNRVVDTSTVQELGDATWPGREEQMRSYPFANEEETLRQMRVFYDLSVKAGAGRDFAIVEDGKPVSFALLYSDGSMGQIEDVATLEPYRNRGYSWRVLMKALAESTATHDLTFLIADDRDWPKDFYSKAGFDAVARHYFFLKRPD